MLGCAIAILGYTWPWLIEAGRLSGWMQLGPDAGGSVGALGWLLLAGWWLAYGANSLLTSPHGRTPATEPQPRGVFSGSSEGGPGRGLRAGMAAFLGPPLAVLGLGCLLAGRFPPPFAMAWLGRTALVAAGAAWLTLVLSLLFGLGMLVAPAPPAMPGLPPGYSGGGDLGMGPSPGSQLGPLLTMLMPGLKMVGSPRSARCRRGGSPRR